MNWADLIFFWRRQESHGVRGERLAAAHLRGRGMRLLAQNVQCGKGELDIVALDGEVLVFVEVRARTSEDFGTPEASVNRAKRKTVRRSARWFVKVRRLRAMETRFDVVAVVGAVGREEIRYHKSAFGWSE
jgi:putative endonuclease